MKLTFIFLMVALVQVQASSFAQNVNLRVRNASLKEIFDELSVQTGYNFMCDVQILDNIKPITLNLSNVPLKEALDKCFAGQPVRILFSDDQTVMIRNMKTERSEQGTAAVVITGKIKDSSGRPIAGVTVTIKNSKASTVSNESGDYKISVPDQHAILVFSYIGFVRQEIPVQHKTVINIVLNEENTGLSEIVVIGYGEVNRKDLTGSVGSVSVKDLTLAPVKSFDDALAGRVAGVVVSSQDGQPGSSAKIIIRGSGSITQDNSPLYVIDGFPIENPDNNVVSSSDIESIDILKDASATAIYGARGANGVIIITTKKGKRGEPVIAYNTYYGFQEMNKRAEMMSPYEFVRYQYAIDPERRKYYVDETRTVDYYQNVKGLDLQDKFYRLGFTQNHDVALRGGNDKTLYSISGNILNQNGVVVNSGFSRYQGRVSLDQNVNEKLKVGMNATYGYTKSDGALLSQFPSGHSSSYLYTIMGYRPTSGFKDADIANDFYDIVDEQETDVRINPVESMKNELRFRNSNNLTANVYFQYKLLKDLTLKITGGLNSFVSNSGSFFNSKTNGGNPRNTAGMRGSVGTSTGSNWLNENTLSYTKRFKKDHNLNVVAGFTMQGNKSGSESLTASFVPNESLGLDGLDEAGTQVFSKGSSSWGLASFLGRVNYTYKSKYLLTASFRSDGSSKFRGPNKWGYFPSGAFSWKMTEENFLKQQDLISTAKLRLSYGLTGNNRVSDFPYLSTLGFPIVASYSFNNSPPLQGVAVGSLGSEDLEWESSAQANIGYDFGLLKDRINMTIDLYRKTTKKLLLNAPIPYVTGYLTAFKNIGSIRNEGLEFTLNTVNIQKDNFTWSTNFNISFNRNEVLGLTEDQNSLLTNVNFASGYSNVPPYIAQVGKPVAQFYGLIWEGVYPYSDFDKTPAGTYILKSNVPDNGTPRNQIQPGFIKYKDINGDGTVTARDFTVIGRGLPVHTGGLSNNFQFKNFDLNLFFQWSYGNDILNANRLIFEGNGTSSKQLNQYATYANRWSPENQSSMLFKEGGQGSTYYSSRVIEDGSYLRLKTISFGYNLPAKLLSRIKVKNLRLSVSTQNLITWTNYSGLDPEVSIMNSNLTPGFDYSAYPLARTITFGLNTSF